MQGRWMFALLVLASLSAAGAARADVKSVDLPGENTSIQAKTGPENSYYGLQILIDGEGYRVCDHGTSRVKLAQLFCPKDMPNIDVNDDKVALTRWSKGANMDESGNVTIQPCDAQLYYTSFSCSAQPE